VTQFNEPKLGTPPDAPISHALHKTGSFLVGDFFVSSFYYECLQLVEGLGPLHKLMLAEKGLELKAPQERIKANIAHAEELIDWAKQMRSEGYHTMNTHVFITLWAAHEAGIENVVATIVRTIRHAAHEAGSKFRRGRYDIDAWPWPEEDCLALAQKLDVRAKEQTPNGGWDSVARLKTLFGWLGTSISLEPAMADHYNEAAMARNVIAHRYGRLGPSEVAHAPRLSEWLGQALPMTVERFRQYHSAIIGMHLAVSNAVWSAGWK
jgi:hypothetical protein